MNLELENDWIKEQTCSLYWRDWIFLKKKIRVHEKSKRESLGTLEETVWLFFTLKKKIRVREKRERVLGFSFWSLDLSLLLRSQYGKFFLLGSIVSPFNCILTQSSPYTACTASTSASTSSSLTMRERFFFPFCFGRKRKIRMLSLPFILM